MLDRRTLPLSALRAFESAARHLHLGRAGEDLGVTHGAISHQIRNLEQILGVELFSRVHRRLELTAAGARLYEAVSGGFDRILQGTLHLDPESISGTLNIGCTPTIAANWAIHHICAFQAAYPQIKIHLLEIQPRQKDIAKQIDVAICYGQPNQAGREIVKLATPSIFAVCSPALIHRNIKTIRADNIAEQTLLHDGQNSWNDWFRSMHVDLPNPQSEIHFANTYMALQAARLGFGVALCNEFETQNDLNEGTLVRLIRKPVAESQNYYLVTNPPAERSVRSRLFEDWITKSIIGQSSNPRRGQPAFA